MKKQEIFYGAPRNLFGAAINHVEIDEKGRMWAHNNEYSTQVNFHPFTGEPAPTKMEVLSESFWENGTKYISYGEK